LERLVGKLKLRKQLQGHVRQQVDPTLDVDVEVEVNDVPIPFEEATLALLCVGASAGVSCGGTGSSALIVEVDVERLNPLVSGAR
jgi:hypothetical protein